MTLDNGSDQNLVNLSKEAARIEGVCVLQASKNPPQCACINNVALIQVGTILYEAVTEKKEDQKQKRMQVLASRAQEPAVLHRQLLSRASCRSLAIPVVYLQPRSLRIAEGVHGGDEVHRSAETA